MLFLLPQLYTDLITDFSCLCRGKKARVAEPFKPEKGRSKGGIQKSCLYVFRGALLFLKQRRGGYHMNSHFIQCHETLKLSQRWRSNRSSYPIYTFDRAFIVGRFHSTSRTKKSFTCTNTPRIMSSLVLDRGRYITCCHLVTVIVLPRSAPAASK